MRKNILLLDDDVDFNSLLTTVFTQADYTVTACQDPQKALKKIEESHFDLIVTDYMMPDMTGLEFTQKIREKTKDLAIIVVSAFLSSQTISALINLGIQGFFNKPLNIFSLLEKTREILEKQTKIESTQNSAPGKNQKNRATFQLTTYPCKDPHSQSLAQKLQANQAFTSSLILVGPEGSPFKSIINDFTQFANDASAPFIYLDSTTLTKETLSNAIKEHSKSPNLTLVLNNLDKAQGESITLMSHLLNNQIQDLPKGLKLRYLFTSNSSPDELLDKGLIDDTFYLRMANSEIKIPPLHDCIEDIPLLAEKLTRSICFKNKRIKIPHLERSAITYLQSQHYEKDFEEFEALLTQVLASTDAEVLSDTDFEEIQKSKPGLFTIKNSLIDLRDDYSRAVYMLTQRNRQVASGLLGVEEDLLQSFISQ